MKPWMAPDSGVVVSEPTAATEDLRDLTPESTEDTFLGDAEEFIEGLVFGVLLAMWSRVAAEGGPSGN